MATSAHWQSHQSSKGMVYAFQLPDHFLHINEEVDGLCQLVVAASLCEWKINTSVLSNILFVFFFITPHKLHAKHLRWRNFSFYAAPNNKHACGVYFRQKNIYMIDCKVHTKKSDFSPSSLPPTTPRLKVYSLTYMSNLLLFLLLLLFLFRDLLYPRPHAHLLWLWPQARSWYCSRSHHFGAFGAEYVIISRSI